MVPAFHPRERGPAELLGRPCPSRGRRSPERRGFGVPSPGGELPDPHGLLWEGDGTAGKGLGAAGDKRPKEMWSAGRAADTSPRHPRVLRHPAWHRGGGGGAVGPRGWRRRVPAGLGTPPTTPRCSKALWEAPCRNHPKTQLGTQPPCGHRCRIPRCRGGGPRGAGEAAQPPATTPSPAASTPLRSPFSPVQAWGPTAPPGHAPLAFFWGQDPPTCSPRCPAPPSPVPLAITDAAPSHQPSAPQPLSPEGSRSPRQAHGGGL